MHARSQTHSKQNATCIKAIGCQAISQRDTLESYTTTDKEGVFTLGLFVYA